LFYNKTVVLDCILYYSDHSYHFFILPPHFKFFFIFNSYLALRRGVCARVCMHTRAHIYICTYTHTCTYYYIPTWRPSNLAVIPSFPASQARHYYEYGKWHSWGPELRTAGPPHLWVIIGEIQPDTGPLHHTRSIPSTPWVHTTAMLLQPTA
jgi:hypothetical protein